MKVNKLIPLWWILISLLFTIHLNSQTNIVGYQYAFNNGEGLQDVAITPTVNFNLITDIDVSNLAHDINVFHIRFLDDGGKWSSMISQLFIKPPEANANSDKKIIGYEYAFNDGEGLQYVAISPSDDFNLITDIDVSNLAHDINVFHIRFLDDGGKWSSMISQLFIKPPEANANSDKKIIGYEYAFNDGEGLQYVAISPSDDFNLITDIDVSNLAHDINVFHIRFLDDGGKWSSMISQLFIKPPEANANSDKKIIGYEYAFNDAEGLQYVALSPADDFNLITDIDVSNLAHDINVFHIRFLDDGGKWSSMISQLFIKPPEIDVLIGNKLASYDYWFDEDSTNKVNVVFSPTAQDVFIQELDMTHIWRGEHQIHTQFKDVYGKYSLVTTDTIVKVPYPLADFTVDRLNICEGETVHFTSSSIDYDIHTWDFGDGSTSTDIDTAHTFTTSGIYTVALDIEETATSLTSHKEVQINVNAYPLNTVSVSTTLPACFGATVTLTADDDDADIDYLWSNGATTQSIDVTSAEIYTVELSRNSGASCSVTSNDVEITFKTEIDDGITVQTNPVILTANQDSATYQWIDCSNGNTPISGETQQTFQPTYNGNFAVEITQNECMVTSNCELVSTVAVSDIAIRKLVNFYPNPNKGVLFVSNEIPIQITIYTMNGQFIRKIKMDEGKSTINIKELSKGLYFVKVSSLIENGISNQTVFKIIKE